MRVLDAYCSTCFYYREGCQVVPVIGVVCLDCLQRLAQPATYELCVQGESVLTLCELFDIEMKSRTESLRNKARDVIEAIEVQKQASQKEQAL